MFTLSMLLGLNAVEGLAEVFEKPRGGAVFTEDFGNIQFGTFDHHTFGARTTMPVSHATKNNVYAVVKGSVTVLFVFPWLVDREDFADKPQMFLINNPFRRLGSLREQQMNDLMSILVKEKIIPRSLQIDYNRVVREDNKKKNLRWKADTVVDSFKLIDMPIPKAVRKKLVSMGLTEVYLDNVDAQISSKNPEDD